MNEKQTNVNAIRPTRKQKVILEFVDKFIAEHGYSPSYREVMIGLDYKSVASVALHIDNLIKRGQLRKRDHSARSLEVVHSNSTSQIKTNQVMPSEEKWLVEKIENAFIQVESNVQNLASDSLDQLYVLIGALKVLGLDTAAQSFMPRLSTLKQKLNA
jgi:repressor LexA